MVSSMDPWQINMAGKPAAVPTELGHVSAGGNHATGRYQSSISRSHICQSLNA